MWISPSLSLTGQLVRLEPLSLDHTDALIDAVHDGNLHTSWWTSTPGPDTMADDIRAKLALRDSGAMVPFACIRRSNEEMLGVTTFYDLSPAIPRLEIGYTWTRASAQGTGTNPDSKFQVAAAHLRIRGTRLPVCRHPHKVVEPTITHGDRASGVQT